MLQGHDIITKEFPQTDIREILMEELLFEKEMLKIALRSAEREVALWKEMYDKSMKNIINLRTRE